MDKILKGLEELLAKYDQKIESVNEATVYDAIGKLKSDICDENTPLPLELKAESMAFGFCEDYPDTLTGWGTYYGPMMVWKDDTGQWLESPSIQSVDTDILGYWTTRANSTEHPVLRSRYADLVWDLTRKVSENHPDISLAHRVIDDTIVIVEKDLYKHETLAIKRLDRALFLALSINDAQRIKAVRDAMISFEDKVAQDDLCGLWGFSCENLIDNKKINLTQGQEDKIIADLEARLKRVSSNKEGGNLHPQAAEHASMLLTRYYRKSEKQEEVKRVLRLYGQAYIDASENAGGLVALSWLQKVFEVFHDNGMHDEANALTQKIHKYGKQSSDEMHTISTEIKIPQEKIELFLSEMTQGNLYEVIARFVWYFVPDPEEVKKQINNLAKKAPIQYLVPKVIQDKEGRAIAKIGSLEEDLEGHVVAQTSQDMQFSAIFINMLIEKLKADNRLDLNEIINYLFESPLYDDDRRKMIEVGVAAYLRGDQITAAHVLIPQIEHALRRLMSLTGSPAYKPARNGGLFLRNMDEILRDEGVNKSLSEKVTHYLRVLLTDQRGWNLRNNICHGLLDTNIFGSTVGNRLLHILLLLAQVREQRELGAG